MTKPIKPPRQKPSQTPKPAEELPAATSANPDDYRQEIVNVCSFIKDRDNKVIFFFQMVGDDTRPLLDLENHYKARGWHCHWILQKPEPTPEPKNK